MITLLVIFMKISIEEFYKSLWRCRDFEIQNLWQRSIFLTAFMLLSYTGYGTVLLKIVELDDCILSLKAGAYSPSKINIAIGQVSFASWVILFLLHSSLICLDLIFSNFREGLISTILFLGIGCSVVVVYAMCKGCSNLQSSALKHNGKYTN